MGSQSQRLAGEVPPFELKHKGQTFRMHAIDDEMLSKIERKIYQRELEAVALQKDALPEEILLKKLADKEKLYLAGEYSIMSEVAKEYFKTKPGLVFLMELLFRRPITDLIGVIVEKQHEVQMLLSTVLHESLDLDIEEEPIRAMSPKVPLTAEEIRNAGINDPKA